MLTKQAIINDLKKILAYSTQKLSAMSLDDIEEEFGNLYDTIKWSKKNVTAEQLKTIILDINKRFNVEDIEQKLEDIFDKIDSVISRAASLEKKAAIDNLMELMDRDFEITDADMVELKEDEIEFVLKHPAKFDMKANEIKSLEDKLKRLRASLKKEAILSVGTEVETLDGSGVITKVKDMGLNDSYYTVKLENGEEHDYYPDAKEVWLKATLEKEAGLGKHIAETLEAAGINVAFEMSEDGIIVEDEKDAKKVMKVLDDSGSFGPTAYNNETKEIMIGEYKEKKSLLKKEASKYTRWASTDSQEEAIETIEETLNLLGIKLGGGTAIGKSPQTVILDIKYQDGAISVNAEGEVKLFGDDVTGIINEKDGIADKLKENGIEVKESTEANPNYEIKTGSANELKEIEASIRKNHPNITDLEVGRQMRDIITVAKGKATDKKVIARLTTAEISNMFPEFDKTGGVWQVEEKNGKKTIIRPDIKAIEEAVENKGHIRKVNDIVLYDDGSPDSKMFEVQIKEILDGGKYKVIAMQTGKEFTAVESQLLDESKIEELM